LGFVVAGLGLVGVPGLSNVWQAAAVIAASLSLLLLVLYWHPWLVIGALLDLVLFGALVWPRWPTLDLAAR
jgi:hypothetical protein